ncbi:MAG: HAD-IIIA family hydrolase [Phycisphaerales bacterium]
MRPAVFLDRDDTINRNADLPDAAWRGTPGDLLDPNHVHLLEGTEHAIRQLKDAGYTIVIITNQGGVARGHGDVADIDAVNDRLRQLLPHDPLDETNEPAPIGRSLIDACYACPHHPSGVVSHLADNHAWRKPNPGMVAAAINELNLDPERSWMVGDKQRDLDAARAAGIAPQRALLLGPGKDIPDLAAAAEIILTPPPVPRVLAASRVVLHADLSADPRPLADERVRETVIASARAIAERTGVELLDTSATDTALTATLAASRVAAMGFAAELRRTTNAWHTKRHDRALWLDRSE